MPITISQASIADKAQLENYFKHYNNQSFVKSRVEAFLNFGHTIVAKDSNTIIGVVQWSVKENPNLGVAEFEEMHVLISHQRQGIGSKLIEEAIKNIRDFFSQNKIKARKLYLFVNQNNKAAQNFYGKFGFKKIADLNDLFADNQIETFYCLDLI